MLWADAPDPASLSQRFSRRKQGQYAEVRARNSTAVLYKVMSLLFNMLSRLVITFLPRSKRLLISWLQSPSSVILEPQKIKSDTVSPSISHEVMGPDAMILVF